jgi:hypothetical protein
VVKLPDGSFKVTTARNGRTRVDSATCLVTHAYSTKYTFSDGTGVYKRITGSGTAQVTERGILPRASSGKCKEKGNPTVFQAVIEARGPISVS